VLKGMVCLRKLGNVVDGHTFSMAFQQPLGLPQPQPSLLQKQPLLQQFQLTVLPVPTGRRKRRMSLKMGG
ncbi:Hypothetical predicted protein, partial [Marmota monax]